MHAENQRGVYGAKKVWAQLNREGIDVGRDRVARLMRQMGLAGRGRMRRRRIHPLIRLLETAADGRHGEREGEQREKTDCGGRQC